LLEKTDQTEEANQLREVFIDRVTSQPNAPPLTLRQLAGECYNKGDYARTETVLRKLLDRGFEIPGTNCHLARALILADRDTEARESATQAWEHRAEAPSYVVPRILWFQTAFALLDGKPPGPFLARIKTALQAEGAIMEWTMEPVLAHLKPKLDALPPEGGTPSKTPNGSGTPNGHALLTALVAAMSFPDQLSALDEFPAWREVEPQALEIG
jgi:hypothetical protein